MKADGYPPFDETRCEEVLIKKVFHLTHKYQENQGNIKTWEAVTPRLDTVKLSAYRILHGKVAGIVQKMIKDWEKVILIILEIL